MANTSGFNQDLDKITEREVVPDFVSRLTFGKDVTNDNELNVSQQILVPKKTKLKDVITRLIMLLPTFADKHLMEIYVVDHTIAVGAKEVTINKPSGKTLVAAISESTGQDIVSCFAVSGSAYKATFNTPYTAADNLKLYFK